MSKADITIRLTGDRETADTYRYRPGDSLHGEIVVYPDTDVNCDRLLVKLAWHTRGRGTRFWQDVAEQDLFQGQLRQGMPRTFNFSFTLPHEPWSYEGHYVSIDWVVQVKIDVPWAKDPTMTETFLLYPDPPDTLPQDDWGAI